MIKVTFTRIREDYKRDQGDDYKPSTYIFEYDSYGALGRLVAMGDSIMEITPTKVVTHGYCMDCDDTDVYEGTTEEMSKIVKTAVLMAQAQGNPHFIENVAAESVRMLGEKSGIPLYMNLGAAIFHAATTVKLMLLQALGLEETSFKTYDELSVDDIITAVQISDEEGISITDSLALAL